MFTEPAVLNLKVWVIFVWGENGGKHLFFFFKVKWPSF